MNRILPSSLLAIALGCAGTLSLGCGPSDDSDDDASQTADANPNIGPAACKNGTLEEGEDCEGIDFKGKTCDDFGGLSGDLVCTDECKIDTSGCSDESCQPDSFEVDNTSEEAGDITIPLEATALTLCGDDEDWFKMTLEEDVVYRFDIAFSDADGAVNVYLFSAINLEMPVGSSVSTPEGAMFEYTLGAGLGNEFLLLADNLAPQPTTKLPYLLTITTP